MRWKVQWWRERLVAQSCNPCPFPTQWQPLHAPTPPTKGCHPDSPTQGSVSLRLTHAMHQSRVAPLHTPPPTPIVLPDKHRDMPSFLGPITRDAYSQTACTVALTCQNVVYSSTTSSTAVSSWHTTCREDMHDRVMATVAPCSVVDLNIPSHEHAQESQQHSHLIMMSCGEPTTCWWVSLLRWLRERRPSPNLARIHRVCISHPHPFLIHGPA